MQYGKLALASGLIIAGLSLGCESLTTASSPCGPDHFLNENVCWHKSIHNADYKKADAVCKSEGYRLPHIKELQSWCRNQRGLPSFDRPGADATMYYSDTRDNGSNTNLLAVTPSCKQDSAVFMNPKYFFCVKDYVAPTAAPSN